MNRTVLTVLKAVAGVVVLALLLLTVTNWWRDYRTEAAKTPSPAASPTAEEGSGESATNNAGGTVVVIVDGLNLREEPDNDAKSLASLKKDDKLVLVKQEGKWYQVKTSDGDTGWVSASPSYTRLEEE